MLLRAVLVCLFLPFVALAQGLPQPLSDNVNDFADLLPPEAEARLSAEIRKIRTETAVHIVVATMDRIANYGGEGQTIEAYAKALFNSWNIGDMQFNDGILILVVRDDRVARIALGSGYDAVYDGRAQRVIDTAMLPEFRQGDYVRGIEVGVASAVDRIVTPFVEHQPVTETSGFAAPEQSYGFLIPLGMALAFAGLVFRRFIGDQAARLNRCANCSHRGLHRTRDVVKAATATTVGQGLLRDHCNNCGHDRNVPFDIARTSRRSGGGGGSSGFGGGRSSGGGATGRW